MDATTTREDRPTTPTDDEALDSFDTNSIDKPTTNKQKSKGISFGEVRVREHERVLNTRASAKYADLTLGWAHHASQRFGVDDFEQKKEDENHQKKKHKNHERLQVLSKYGYSPKDVLKLENDKKKVLERKEKGLAEQKELEDVTAMPKSRGFLRIFWA